jgi:hypothetical protein
VTRIEIKAGDFLKYTIDDPAIVNRIVAFVNEQQGGRGGLSDWAGVPVPRLFAYFYSGSEFKGYFAVGPGFFECQREGDFWSKRCEVAEEFEFLELVGSPFYDLRR